MKKVEVVKDKIRKVRSDKKRDVKPTVSVELKNCVYRLSYITNTPVKDVVEIICEKGLESRKVLEYLSHYFRRDYQFVNTIFIGDPGRESLQKKSQSGKNERITTRFNQDTYEKIKYLSGALDVTPTKATALLLEASIRNTELLNSYMRTFLRGTLDKMRMKELKQVQSFVKKSNPYSKETSWFDLIDTIVEDVKDNTVNIKESITTWLDRLK